MINQALAAIEEARLESNSYVTHAIASVGVAHLKINGTKDPQLEWFDPIAPVMARREAKREISVRAARTFLELEAANKVPGWALALLDLESIKYAAD